MDALADPIHKISRNFIRETRKSLLKNY